MAYISRSIVGKSVGFQMSCSPFPFLKVVICPPSYPLNCPLFQYIEVAGNLICMAKVSIAAIRLLTFLIIVVGYPLKCSLFRYISGYCDQPQVVHLQSTPLPTCSPLATQMTLPWFFFFSYGYRKVYTYNLLII